jgi:signal transduction histidine kinase
LESTAKPLDRLAVISTPPASSDTSLSNRIAAIASLGARILGAEICAIAFQPSQSSADKIVSAGSGDSRLDGAIRVLLGALANRVGDKQLKPTVDAPESLDPIEIVALSAYEIDAIAPLAKIDVRRTLSAYAFINGTSTVRIAIALDPDRNHSGLEPSLELIARAVLNEISVSEARALLGFWRSHGAEKSRQAIDAERELARQREVDRLLSAKFAAAHRAQPGEQFARFGELVASGAGFDQWIVAVTDAGMPKVVATSPGLEDFDAGKSTSALMQSSQRRIVIERHRDRDGRNVDTGRPYHEDRILAGSYVCIPFDAGAIALASRDGVGLRLLAEAIVERLAPLVSVWVMERELSRRDALVRRLALRMFVAIDEERARIARDLHDDQAQLIAAVKIALEGRQDAARTIFEEVEKELRRKIHELRPATLGNISLDEAIEREFARLRRTGIGGKLLHGGTVEKISRPVEQLCFQVVREALSNVIRHSRATSVEVAIEKIDAAARVSVSDDGRGIDRGKIEGAGIGGMRERLELMGGSLKVESRAAGTTVVAEIPELS